jgi:hypothetical protein
MRWDDLSEAQTFDEYMSSVNQRLIDDGVDVEARPMRAWLMVQRELKVGLAMPGAGSERIFAWFRGLYGERLHIDFSPGRILVMLRGDAWAMKLPRVFGTPPPLPFVRMIEKSTETLIHGLATEELDGLKLIARRAMEAFSAMENKLPLEVQADWRTAVDQVVTNHHSYGLSKWSSQQAVEKVLSAYVSRNGGNTRLPRRAGFHAHSLEPLVEEAERVGLQAVDRQLLAQAECSASARYPGRLSVTVQQAVAANQSSILICGAIARQC